MRTYTRKRLLTWIFVLLALPVFYCSNDADAKYPDEPKIAAALLRKDFTVLRRTLEEAHPALYWYTAKPAMDRLFDSTYALLNQDMTRSEFFRLLLPVIAAVRCVHTGLRPGSGHPVRSSRLLPFDFLCAGDRLFITRDFSGAGYAGAEVISINQVPSKEIISRLLACLPADGYNETFRYHLLNTGALREGYALYFGQPAVFKMEIRGPDTVSAQPVTVKAAGPRQFAVQNKEEPPPVELHFRDEMQLAVLSVNTFQVSTGQFRATILPVFKALEEKGVKHLIIDLRRNGGGNNDNVPELFSFLATHPFLHLKKTRMNARLYTYRQYFTHQKDVTTIQGVRQADGSYSVDERYAGTAYRAPANKYRFNGETILLTSGNTTSAASEFVAIARYNRRVLVAGEETGGCYYGATGGNYLHLVLPASKLEARIPTIQILTAVDEDTVRQPKGRGVIPDYPIVPTIKEVLAGRDGQLEEMINRIKKQGM